MKMMAHVQKGLIERKTSILFLLVISLIGTSTLQLPTISQEDSSLKVGVVDIKQVYSSYDRAKDFSEKIQQKKSEAEQKIKDTNEQIEQVKKELSELEPLSDLWKKRAQKFYQLKSKRKMLEDLWKQDTKKLLGETSAEIYRSISEVISAYGEENGYDLILKANNQPIGQNQAADINQQIATRSVLHFKNKMDLTDKIIEILNEQYEENNENGGSSSN